MLISAPSDFAERDFAESRRAGADNWYGRAYVESSTRTPHPLFAASEVFAS